MTELFKVIGIGIVTLIAYIIIKPLKPDIAVFISVLGASVILMLCIDGLVKIIDTMTDFVNKTGIDSGLFSCVLKIVGIGYVTEFASNLCINAGNSSIADVISLAGKITILVLSLPILTSLINLIVEILP